jgi:hypothetical protein
VDHASDPERVMPVAARRAAREAARVTSEADDGTPRTEGRWARHQAQSRRMVAKIFIGLAALWVLLTVVRWLDEDSSALSRWLNTVVAAGWIVVAVLHWWKFLRRPPS